MTTTHNLDRAGIFKAKPYSWQVRTSENSQAVAISIEFIITAQLDNGEWVDWSEFEPHSVWGDFWIVKKDGSINTTTVEQVVKALGWSGDLREVQPEKTPDKTVQITVKENVYEGRTSFRASWIEHENFVPKASGASDTQVGQLQTRFGSLLRAAAASAKKASGGAAPPAKKTPARRPPPPKKEEQRHLPDEPDDDTDAELARAFPLTDEEIDANAQRKGI